MTLLGLEDVPVKIGAWEGDPESRQRFYKEISNVLGEKLMPPWLYKVTGEVSRIRLVCEQFSNIRIE